MRRVESCAKVILFVSILTASAHLQHRRSNAIEDWIRIGLLDSVRVNICKTLCMVSCALPFSLFPTLPQAPLTLSLFRSLPQCPTNLPTNLQRCRDLCSPALLLCCPLLSFRFFSFLFFLFIYLFIFPPPHFPFPLSNTHSLSRSSFPFLSFSFPT